MEINKTPLTQCIKTRPLGLTPAVDPMEDLVFKKDYQCNSWWVGGDYDVDGHEVTFVYHLMTVEIPLKGVVFSYRFTFSDVTTGLYIDTGETSLPMRKVKIGKDKFSIEVPTGIIEGDWDNMIVKMSAKNCGVDLKLKAIGYPLLNGGNGTFCWQETLTHQISVPTMETVGDITVDGHTYTLKDNGYSWFDRQWQNNAKNPKRLMNLAWAWMCIRMENGDVISVWSNPVDEQEDSFATIRHIDGAQTVTYAKPLSSGITHYWHSLNSGKDWPVGWDVELPEFDCKLHVSTYPYNQEMYSEMKVPGSCYEGISKVTGTYKGMDVNARCFVEITGEWSGRCARTGADEVK